MTSGSLPSAPSLFQLPGQVVGPPTIKTTTTFADTQSPRRQPIAIYPKLVINDASYFHDYSSFPDDPIADLILISIKVIFISLHGFLVPLLYFIKTCC